MFSRIPVQLFDNLKGDASLRIGKQRDSVYELAYGVSGAHDLIEVISDPAEKHQLNAREDVETVAWKRGEIEKGLSF